MASKLSQYPRALPVLGSLAVFAIAGSTYANRRRPIMLDSASNPPTKAFTFPSGMLFSKRLTVTHTEQVNHDTKRVTFALPGGKSQVSGVPAGSAILTQHTPAGGWFPVFRPYTPISDPNEPGTLQLLVKQYPNGKASSHIHSLQPGDQLTVRGPIPGYTYTPSSQSQPRDLIFVAGGAGITPIYSLMRGILQNMNDNTRVQLLWGINGTRDIVLKSELEALDRTHPGRLQVTYALSGADGALENEKYRKGYINKSVLQEAIARCEKGSWGDAKGTKVWLCGPPMMESALAGKGGALAELGVIGNEVHKF
ncbi:unnamed protein product [Zymoseptoria tritici ST99CH_3D7]|uniref:NADH-cytochrome b5 reductase 2 n=1 Tax=Zymoseptoria tritici (strain ST99CH_3D7) TaxID=1276538 RepID=A0A1X7S9L3_ZYMT9|nr:unnamed protein product [Zymoseptoria tritici ST99CH_3D7]